MILATLGKVLSRNFNRNPIFVVGSGRSGTSVLVQALGKHPAIYSFNGEAPLIWMLGSVVSTLEFSGDRKRNYYSEAFRVTFDYIYGRLRLLAFESAFGQNSGFRQIVKGMVSRELNPFSVTKWCAKTFPTEQIAEALLKLYPTAKFIYIHRNGLEVVHSRTQFPGFRDLDFRRHCKDWVDSANTYAYLLQHPHAFSVSHSDLISDPDVVFQEIISFLGLNADSGPANFARSNQIHPLSSTSNVAEVDIKAAMAKREKHYEHWSVEQRDIFRQECSKEMAELGYQMPF